MADLQNLFPGHPLARNPGKGGGGGSSKPRDFYSPGMFNEYFDNLENVDPLKIPGWLWEKEKAGIKSSFKVSAPEEQSVSISDIEDFGEEDLEDLPGPAGLTVNANPLAWINDPVKEAKNFLSDSVSSIADYDDFRQRVKKEMWGAAGVKEGQQTGMLRDDASPFYIGDNDDYSKTVYDTAAFMGDNKSMKSRNKNFRKLSSSMGNALVQKGALDDDGNLKPGQRDGELVRLMKADPTVFDHITDSGGNAIGADIVEGFSAQLDVVDSLSRLDKSLGKVTGDLSVGMLSTTEKQQRDATFFKAGREGGDVNDKLAGLSKALENAEASIARAEGLAALGGGAKFAAEDLAPVKSYVAGLRQNIEQHVTVGTSATGNTTYAFQAGSAGGLHRAASIQKGRLYRSTADAGIGGRYHKKVIDKNIYNKGSDLNKVIDTTPQVSKQGKNVGAVIRAVNRDHQWNTTMDLVNAWDDGKLVDQYVWSNLILPRIERFTPSYHIKKFIKEETNSFGLGAQVLKNEFKVDIPGIGGAVSLSGGAQFGMEASTIAKAMPKGGASTMFEMLHMSEADVLAAGMKKAEHEALAKSLEFLKNKSVSKKLGLTLDAAGEIADSAANRRIIDSVYRKVHQLKVSPGALDPKLKLVSALGKYNAFLSKVQSNALVKVYNAVGKVPDQIFQEIMVKFGRLLEVAFGTATEGIGLIISWLIRIIVAKLIKKVMEGAKKAFKSLKQGDMSAVFEGYESVYNSILKLALWVLAPLFTIIILVNFLMGSLMSIIPNFDSTKVGGNVVGESTIEVPPANVAGTSTSTTGGGAPVSGAASGP